MNLIDFHCDTLWNLGELGGIGDLYRNDGQVSIEGMKQAGTKAQFMALFSDGGNTLLTSPDLDPRTVKPGKKEYDVCYELVLSKINYFEDQMKLYEKDIAKTRSFEELKKHESEGRISAILTVEESGILADEMERLDVLYEKGIRLMTLLWNYENCLGYPNHSDPRENAKGLKNFGKDVVQRMDELEIIFDVAHASDGTFWDIMKYSKGPVVASHSNCRALCPHPRNLTDEMIRAIAERGGVAGLNLYGHFLNAAGPCEGKLEDMVRHIHYMINKGGAEFPAIGTDLDGIGKQEGADIMTVADMPKLYEALHRSGLSDDQIDRIWHLNGERVLRMI